MTDLAESKLELIREISNEQDAEKVQAVAIYYHALKTARQEAMKKYAGQIRKRLDPEMLKRKQKLKGHDEEKIMRIIRKMDIQEPVEVLLSQLTK
ncbi:MAG: hypothetical protein ACKVUS_16435 [Saprospiraceae bacterium]